MAKPRLMYYHDGRHPLIYMYEPPIHREQYEQAVDELVGTPVDAIMFCLGDGRTVLHDTQVGELWGHNVDKWGHMIFRRAAQNARHLIEEGHDPLRVICDRAHAHGLPVYPVLFGNQGSGERGSDVRGSDFRFDNKHLDIDARGDLDPDFPGMHCADYMHEEVRQERLALIEETLKRYPVDGFELQMNYVAYYFRPDQVDQGRPVMNDWVRQVYDLVKRSGADRELAIRIPENIGDCLAVGLDPQEWIRQGTVDVLIGASYGCSARLDPEADFRPLVEAAKGSACRIHATLHSTVDTDRMAEGPIEAIRGAACNYWAQGIDGLYLSQWFIRNWPYDGSFYEKLREVAYPEIMAPRDKTYGVPPKAGEGYELEESPNVPLQLPRDLAVEEPVQVRITVSDDLPRWAAQDRVHEVLLRVRVLSTSELDRLRFRLNGAELPESSLRKINRMYVMAAPRRRITGYWYIFRLEPENWPRQGENTLEITLLERDPDVLPQIEVRDVELDTRYLMGRNFYRSFDDPDLGPIEASVT